MFLEKTNLTLPKLNPKHSKSTGSASVFSADQLAKYRRWFVTMSKNKQGTVPLNEIAVVFISTGLSRNRKLFDDMFDGAAGSTLITFEQFMEGIEASILARKLSVNALDGLVSEDANLSTDTILYQERRRLLMQHIVDRPAVRAWGVEQANDVDVSTRSRRRGKMKSMFELSRLCDKERAETSEIVHQLKDILDEEKEKQIMISPVKYDQSRKSLPVLLPLEDLLSKELLAVVDTEQEYVFDSSGNLRTDTSPLSPGAGRTGAILTARQQHTQLLTRDMDESVESSSEYHAQTRSRGLLRSRSAASVSAMYSRSHKQGSISCQQQHPVESTQTWLMKRTCAVALPEMPATTYHTNVRAGGRGTSHVVVYSDQCNDTLLDDFQANDSGPTATVSHRVGDTIPNPYSSCRSSRPALIRWSSVSF